MSDGAIDTALRTGAQLLASAPLEAAAQARAILSAAPRHPAALGLLGRALRRAGRPQEAAAAEQSAIEASLETREIVAARAALARGDLADTERHIRAVLRRSPDDVIANMMLAEIAARLGVVADAEQRLRHAQALAPDYPEAAINLALVLFQQGRVDEALVALDRVLTRDPAHVRAAASKANILAQTGDYAAAAQCWQHLIERVPANAEVWMWYGHLLKTMGRQQDSVAAYRRATQCDPDLAEAWWSLTELKAARATDEDIHAMHQSLRTATSDSRRLFLHFALGKALEDSRNWGESFRHYEAGNWLRRALEPHDQSAVEREVDASGALYDAAFLKARAGRGDPAPDPIFVLGMPRAGSTLVEQILSSHSQVEGTAELPDIPLLVQSLVAQRWQDARASYPELMATLPPAALRELGARYLERARRHRKTSAPFFIDKLPNNWRYVAFIHLILPNAKIIDARRDPLACCFSNFKQHFARGQTFAYDFDDLAAYYRTYLRALAHADAVLPGLVHRVQHEALVHDPETEIRRLLDHLGLPFEEACLRPHENRRAVRTASSEQVRRPINRDALDHWRHYEPWLDPLKRALGPLAGA